MHSLEALESRTFLSSTPHLGASASQLVFDQVAGVMTAPQTLTLKNTGSGKLSIKSITIGGADAGQFVMTGVNPRHMSLGRGASMTLKFTFMPYAVALSGATLQVTSNDPA